MVQSGGLRGAWFLQAVHLPSQLKGSIAGEVGNLLPTGGLPLQTQGQ